MSSSVARQEARAGPAQCGVAGRHLDAAQDPLLALRAESGHPAQPAAPHRLGKFADAGDAEVPSDLERALRADARDLREQQGARRHRGP